MQANYRAFCLTNEIFAMTDTLLSLSEAARRLGVHASTLRRWADGGSIRVTTTPGGHRRFSSAEVDRVAGGSVANAPSQSNAEASPGAVEGSPAGAGLEAQALSTTRTQIRHHDARWLDLTEAEKEEKRMLGRRLVGLMMQYVAADEGEGDHFLAEAKAIGRIHARSAMHEGLELSETLKATLFFRDNIVESAVMLPESLRDQPEAKARLYRRINTYMNEIQLTIADVYQAERKASA
ncbi:MAG: excisionase family DNA binding protein [Rhodothermales bacterium]